MRKLLLYGVFILVSNMLFAQDIHWSQFDFNPVFQNPANVGQFDDGDWRFHANYRDQWRSVTVPFQTFNISADGKSVFHEDLSVGAYFFHDVAGDGRFRTIELQPSLSWLWRLSSDSMHVLRTGAQFGINYRQFDPTQFTFDSQWNGAFFDPSLATNEMFLSENVFNLSAGVGMNYEYFQSKRARFTVGTGLFNIMRPNQGFFVEDIPRELRWNIFGRAQYKIDLDWDILPSFQVNIQDSHRELIIGSQARYIMIDRMGEYRALFGGLYHRVGDAFYVIGGMEWQNWWAGISYDVNVSSLAVASRGRGGIEFSLRYIINNIKPKNIIYRVCPDYI